MSFDANNPKPHDENLIKNRGGQKRQKWIVIGVVSVVLVLCLGSVGLLKRDDPVVSQLRALHGGSTSHINSSVRFHSQSFNLTDSVQQAVANSTTGVMWNSDAEQPQSKLKSPLQRTWTSVAHLVDPPSAELPCSVLLLDPQNELLIAVLIKEPAAKGDSATLLARAYKRRPYTIKPYWVPVAQKNLNIMEIASLPPSGVIIDAQLNSSDTVLFTVTSSDLPSISAQLKIDSNGLLNFSCDDDRSRIESNMYVGWLRVDVLLPEKGDH